VSFFSLLPIENTSLTKAFLVDEETKAEFAEMQKNGGPLGAVAGGQSANTAQQIQNFDLAGWMAGKSSAPAS
jgi:hypothetical protein